MACGNRVKKIENSRGVILTELEWDEEVAFKTMGLVAKLPKEIGDGINAIATPARGGPANLTANGSGSRSRLILAHSKDGEFFGNRAWCSLWRKGEQTGIFRRN